MLSGVAIGWLKAMRAPPPSSSAVVRRRRRRRPPSSSDDVVRRRRRPPSPSSAVALVRRRRRGRHRWRRRSRRRSRASSRGRAMQPAAWRRSTGPLRRVTVVEPSLGPVDASSPSRNRRGTVARPSWNRHRGRRVLAVAAVSRVRAASSPRRRRAARSARVPPRGGLVVGRTRARRSSALAPPHRLLLSTARRAAVGWSRLPSHDLTLPCIPLMMVVMAAATCRSRLRRSIDLRRVRSLSLPPRGSRSSTGRSRCC